MCSECREGKRGCVACKKELIPYLKELVEKYRIDKIPVNGIVSGGATGQDSIYNALSAANRENDGDSIVLIHDGVRPLIDDRIISANIRSVKKYGSAITCTRCTETPIVSKDEESVFDMPKRQEIFTAKAPQSFRLKDVMKAHEECRKVNPDYLEIIDTCTLMHRSGFKVRMVEGNKDNIKVTTPDDYIDLLSRLSAEDHKQIMKLTKTANKRTK